MAARQNATCWVLTDGGVGMVNQALGLAEAMGFEPVLKTVRPRGSRYYLSPLFWLAPLSPAAAGGDKLAPPWPDLVVACGSKSIWPALAIRRRSAGRTRAIYVQRPQYGAKGFDLVVAPVHDGLDGANVLSVRGAVNRVTRQRLNQAAAKYTQRFAHLPRPRVAVLIGGDNGVYRLTPEFAAKFADQLAQLCQRDGAGLLVSASRRTGREAEALIRERLSGLPAYVWDGTGDNPYFAFLGLADAAIVTCDSVNMVSEALATGKPVHVAMLEGGSAKFDRFHEDLWREGYTRPFTSRLESWSYAPLDDTAKAAAEARKRLGFT
ncbi:MAG: mitochondrial fission ELM1 family protein [Rhodospirillales bacterium]